MLHSLCGCITGYFLRKFILQQTQIQKIWTPFPVSAPAASSLRWGEEALIRATRAFGVQCLCQGEGDVARCLQPFSAFFQESVTTSVCASMHLPVLANCRLWTFLAIHHFQFDFSAPSCIILSSLQLHKRAFPTSLYT